jgi:hypothetical protein
MDAVVSRVQIPFYTVIAMLPQPCQSRQWSTAATLDTALRTNDTLPKLTAHRSTNSTTGVRPPVSGFCCSNPHQLVLPCTVQHHGAACHRAQLKAHARHKLVTTNESWDTCSIHVAPGSVLPAQFSRCSCQAIHTLHMRAYHESNNRQQQFHNARAPNSIHTTASPRLDTSTQANSK